jgi:methionine-rich copper-binding protein CopC
MSRRLLRALSVALLCGLALLLGTSPAFAHTRLESSDPADGASLDAAPTQVSLTFNESVPAEFAQITVIGPDGTSYPTGAVVAADGVLTAPVAGLGPAGRYEIGYRVVSDDGHPVTGSLAFTLTTAAAPSSAAAAPTAPTPAAPAPAAAAQPDDGGAPVWPWIAGAVALVAAGVVAALRLGRSG